MHLRARGPEASASWDCEGEIVVLEGKPRLVVNGLVIKPNIAEELKYAILDASEGEWQALSEGGYDLPRVEER